MKNFKTLKFVLVAALLVGFTSCDSLLDDVEPATSVSGEQVLSTEDGVNALRASMFSKVRENFSMTTAYFVAPDAFSDILRMRPGASRYEGLNNAEDGSGGTDHLNNWGLYEIIQDANLLIGGVGDDVIDQATLDVYRGEALALRAFAMHNMVRVYGYEPGNFSQGPEGNWDAGIIIRTEPVLDLSDADLRPRSSVTEVYDQILADLSEAKTLLSGRNDDNTYITEAFVDGLTARVNLYAGNWSDAATAAQNAINNFPGSLVDTEAGIANMFFEGASNGDHPEALFKIVVNPDTENSTGGGSWSNNGPGTYTSDGFLAQLPTQFVIDQYEAADYRNGWYLPCAETMVNTGLTTPQNCDAINDNGFASVKFNGTKGQSVDDLPMMRIAEVYLIWAEAAAKASGISAGVGPLNDLRSARNASSVAAGDFANIEEFEEFILDERIRELAVEGHRFYDLKRLAREVTNPDGSTKFRADSYRILAEIGSGLRNVNDQLEENPGYDE